jgi:hypothetical protein
MRPVLRTFAVAEGAFLEAKAGKSPVIRDKATLRVRCDDWNARRLKRLNDTPIGAST